jgi:hypothetical protein
MEPSKGHQAMEPSKGHQAMEPYKGHQVIKPFKGHRAMEPPKGHQAMEPSIGHQVGIFLHLLLLKKANSDHLELSLQRIIFNSNLENTCSHSLFEEEKND